MRSLVGLQENYTIYDTGDSVRALRRAMGQLQIDASGSPPEAIARAISWAKNNLITPDQYQAASRAIPWASVVKAVYPAYQRQLATSNAVDFDDLLLHVATILRENPEVRASLDERYRFILVDEYQDTNLAQYAIARALSIDYPNLAVTGDPDQSIYGWRGANLNNILDFEKDFPEVHVVRLERNYRSTKRILRVADELISPQPAAEEEGPVHRERAGRAGAAGDLSPRTRTRPRGSPREIAEPIRSGRRRPAISPSSIASTP